MLAIVDSRAPGEAIANLGKICSDILLLKTEGITYDSISCHPDIFIYLDDSNLILAPNSPAELFEFLERNRINYKPGNSIVGTSLKGSASYNCIGTDKFFFHKKGFTDKIVLDINKHKQFVNLSQSYTRCSLIHIGGSHSITSDRGIEKALLARSLSCFYFDPSAIRINGHKNGFLGGTCGIKDDKIYFLGNILKHKNGNKLKTYIERQSLKIIPLCEEPLYDGGGIFFV